MSSAQELYKEALNAIQAGDQENAMRLLLDSLQADSTNLSGWLTLAEIMPDSDDKFDVLEKIFELDPDNAFANAEWDRLNNIAETGFAQPEPAVAAPSPTPAARSGASDDFLDDFDDLSSLKGSAASKKNAERMQELQVIAAKGVGKAKDAALVAKERLDQIEGELAPGVSKREGVIASIIMLTFTIFMFMCSSLVVGISGSQRADFLIAETARSIELTEIVIAPITQQALTQQALSVQATQTVLANVPPTEIPTETPFFELPTEIPDTPTPTPTLEGDNRLYPLPPDSAGGRMVMWGGRNIQSRDFFFLYDYNFASQTLTQIDSSRQIAHPTTNLQRNQVLFVEYEPRGDQVFISDVPGSNLSTASNRTDLLWQTTGAFEADDPDFSGNGSYLLFDASTSDGTSRELFIYNYITRETRRITRDAFNYNQGAISANGLLIVAQKDGATGMDLVLIEVLGNLEPESLPQTLITTDGNVKIEGEPQFSPDGRLVVFTLADSATPNNHDIYIYDLGTREVRALISTAFDERYPTFDPTNRYVAYASNETGVYNVYVLDTISMLTFQITTEDVPIFPGDWSN